MARAQGNIPRRGAVAELARITAADDERTAMRVVCLLAQGHSLARALRVIRISDHERQQTQQQAA